MGFTTSAPGFQRAVRACRCDGCGRGSCYSGGLAVLGSFEYASELGEVIKTAVLAGEEALAQIDASARAVAGRNPGALVEAVELCVRAKAAVVAEDLLDRGPRRALNLGRTFGKTIEHVAG
ncbi:MAG: 3-dehydroquinate synthase family protein [Planctomycetota bacterium]